MKTKHYDRNVLFAIRQAMFNLYYWSFIDDTTYSIEVVNIEHCEHTGLDHIKKCFSMNKSLFKALNNNERKKLVVMWNPDRMINSPEERKKIYVEPLGTRVFKAKESVF